MHDPHDCLTVSDLVDDLSWAAIGFARIQHVETGRCYDGLEPAPLGHYSLISENGRKIVRHVVAPAAKVRLVNTQRQVLAWRPVRDE